MAIEVGEYIRTKEGNIGKITKIVTDNIFYVQFYDNLEWKTDFEEAKIKKHSKNIIDLIEVGDYVNGSKVIDIAQGKTKAVWIESQEQKFALIPIVEKQIKSIVTKEMYKSVEYTIN